HGVSDARAEGDQATRPWAGRSDLPRRNDRQKRAAAGDDAAARRQELVSAAVAVVAAACDGRRRGPGSGTGRSLGGADAQGSKTSSRSEVERSGFGPPPAVYSRPSMTPMP